MMRAVLTIATLLSVVFFPWKFAAALALIVAIMEPLVPLSAGILADVLYYAPQAHTAPLFTVYGAVCTVIALALRNRIRASIIGG